MPLWSKFWWHPWSGGPAPLTPNRGPLRINTDSQILISEMRLFRRPSLHLIVLIFLSPALTRREILQRPEELLPNRQIWTRKQQIDEYRRQRSRHLTVDNKRSSVVFIMVYQINTEKNTYFYEFATWVSYLSTNNLSKNMSNKTVVVTAVRLRHHSRISN